MKVLIGYRFTRYYLVSIFRLCVGCTCLLGDAAAGCQISDPQREAEQSAGPRCARRRQALLACNSWGVEVQG